MTDFLIKGREYRLIGNPLCVCTYRGEGFGYGIDIYGKEGDNIYMGDSSQWELYRRSRPIEPESNLDLETAKSLAVIADDAIRTFATGANRNSDEGKLDFEGFLSPTVLKAYAEYMHKNRFLENGTMRDSDNWQKGIPVDAYMKSMYRHFFDAWSNHRGIETPETQVQNLCGLMFNAMGMLHETLKNE